MPFFAMRLTDGLVQPSVLRWGTQDFQATDPTFDPLIHDQVFLRTDVSQAPGVPTRYHRAVIVPPDVVSHTLEEMSQAEKDAIDLVIEPPFRVISEFAIQPAEATFLSSSFVGLGSVTLNLTKVFGDPSLLSCVGAFSYASDGALEARLHAVRDAGGLDLNGLRTFSLPIPVGSFSRVRTGLSDPLPTDNELIEYTLLARLTTATTAQIRSVTLALLERM